MLSTGERLLLAVHHGPRSVRALAALLRVDVASVHRMLAHYEREGVLARRRGPRDAADQWRVAQGVRVEYRPGRVLVHGAGAQRDGEDAAAPAAGWMAAPAAAPPVAAGPPSTPAAELADTPPAGGERPRCAAVTTRGSRCTRRPRNGDRCDAHTPAP